MGDKAVKQASSICQLLSDQAKVLLVYSRLSTEKQKQIPFDDIRYEKQYTIVKNITSDKKRWRDIMMKEELNLSKEFASPMKSAIIVLIASFIGSIIPLISFFFFPIKMAVIYSLIISAIALFITGAIEAKLTLKNWLSKGLQLMLIGMGAALIGFLVGKFAGFSG